MQKPLIVYYSFSGTTRAVAQKIAEHTGGDIRELIPLKPYAFNYNAATKEARSEIARGYCPDLTSGNESIDEYEMIYIGTPNWFKSLAPPVLSFLRSHDFSGKSILAFCTHGGGGFGEIEKQIKAECIGATVLPGLVATDATSLHDIAGWLNRK